MSRKILVLEDEAIVATDIADELTEAGWNVVGPAGSIGHAETLADKNDPFAALLDINLRGEKSYGLATRLRQKGVHVIFLTGYASTSLPSELSDCPVVPKPVSMPELMAVLNRTVNA